MPEPSSLTWSENLVPGISFHCQGVAGTHAGTRDSGVADEANGLIWQAAQTHTAAAISAMRDIFARGNHMVGDGAAY